MMPDLTNNVIKQRPQMKQGVDVLRGSSTNSGSRLPDLTASTGFSAARELKSGSVMDILGKKK